MTSPHLLYVLLIVFTILFRAQLSTDSNSPLIPNAFFLIGFTLDNFVMIRWTRHSQLSVLYLSMLLFCYQALTGANTEWTTLQGESLGENIMKEEVVIQTSLGLTAIETLLIRSELEIKTYKYNVSQLKIRLQLFFPSRNIHYISNIVVVAESWDS